MKTIEIYCNYGVLGAEKRNVYTFGAPHFRGTCSDEMTVIVPEGWELYETISGGTGVTAPWGWDYELNEVLTDIKGHPAFSALDKNGRPITAYLYTEEELEEKKKNKIWSVELEATLWSDDTFTGTYEECIDYCEQNDYEIDGEHVRLAKILVDEEGSFLETLDVVEEL